MIHSGEPSRLYVNSAVCHVPLRQGVTMSSKSPASNRKQNGNVKIAADQDVSEEELKQWNVIERTSEFLRRISKVTMNVPDQVRPVQQKLIMFYITLNNSVMTALGKAEELLVSAQNKSQDSPSAPFINVAVEQLKRATSELNNAMKRVSDLLETMNNEKDEAADATKQPDSPKTKKGFSRFSFKSKKQE